MVNIYVVHCDGCAMKNVVDVIRQYQIYRNIKLFVSINFEYELEYFARHRDMDIAILEADYTYNGYDGIFVGKRIKIINRNTLIIFLCKTADKNHLINIIDSEPFAYIQSKDILVKLPIVLKNAISIISKDTSAFTYRKRGEQINLSLKKTIYFSSSHRIIKYICIDGREDYFYEKMDNIENVVSKSFNNFIRVNQSYLVNMKYIVSLVGNEIIMVNNHIITISRKYYGSKHTILQKINRL